MDERITRGKAIRLKCLDCCCGNSAEVRRCPATNCPLWRYRLGNSQFNGWDIDADGNLYTSLIEGTVWRISIE